VTLTIIQSADCMSSGDCNQLGSYSYFSRCHFDIFEVQSLRVPSLKNSKEKSLSGILKDKNSSSKYEILSESLWCPTSFFQCDRINGLDKQ